MKVSLLLCKQYLYTEIYRNGLSRLERKRLRFTLAYLRASNVEKQTRMSHLVRTLCLLQIALVKFYLGEKGGLLLYVCNDDVDVNKVIKIDRTDGERNMNLVNF